MLYIGIDLGTSAVKLLLMDGEGTIQNIVSKEYPLEFPHPGWSQQNPEDWRRAVLEGIPELLHGFDASQVAGIGAGGQMHGLVVLDENDSVIRPAILWNDGRTAKQVDYLNGVVGKETLSKLTANIAFAGFTAPKLLWMRENERSNFAKIAKIMLPKDYINYLLTGVHCTDYSDASGMLLLDVEHKCWSKEMLDLCGVTEAQMPRLLESYEKVPESVVVCAGAGDNAAAAVGTGTVGEGACNISLGTSGTVFISSEKFGVDPRNGLHAFAHADGRWHLMGCMLSAASCNKWLMAGEQPGILPALPDGGALPHQRHQRPGHLHRHDHGHQPVRSDPSGAGGCSLRHPGQFRSGESPRHPHPPQQALRRRSQESPVADHPIQRAEHLLGPAGERAGPGDGRRHAGHGGLWLLPLGGGGL